MVLAGPIDPWLYLLGRYLITLGAIGPHVAINFIIMYCCIIFLS